MRMEVKEGDALVFALGITLFIFFLTLVLLNSSIKSVNSKIEAKKIEYEKAVALYDKIKSNNLSKKILKENILVFVQKLETANGLKDKIVSVSTTDTNGSVRLKMVGLDLLQLIDVFKTVGEYGNIVISQFVIKRNFSSPNLADLDIVLRKKI